MMEDTQAQKYFIRSCNVWFPDFETVIENMERRFRKQSFHALLVLELPECNSNRICMRDKSWSN